MNRGPPDAEEAQPTTQSHAWMVAASQCCKVQRRDTYIHVRLQYGTCISTTVFILVPAILFTYLPVEIDLDLDLDLYM